MFVHAGVRAYQILGSPPREIINLINSRLSGTPGFYSLPMVRLCEPE